LQNCNLHLHLRGIRGVLIVTSAALPEVGTAWRYAMFGGSQNPKQRSLSEGIFLFKQASFNKLSLQHEGHKHSLARIFAFGLMSQPGATIYRLFNL
jgi:hypothetical protein